ncbi:hypothetical protein PENTCL1PPCAC_9627 [Pristionchus entomophagus]|uniref:Protein kinase domain-containing protein n=1 Tax=Pristionchus entomophagus TaxID=358040 RepID=A0AAV5SYL8_9BILA|nr:hypothetical protein PENTCL1PPCAC_9627 [Pristionchus entomophagus]
MGNYKSRPPSSCSDEFKKKISEGYSLARSRLNDDVKQRSASWTPLQNAAFDGRAEIFSSLLDDVEARAPHDLSLLHLIAAGHGAEQAEKLGVLFGACGTDEAKRRALLSHTTTHGFSALQLAIHKADVSVVSALLESGADPAFVGGPPALPALHIAAMAGSSPITRLLLRSGATVLATDSCQFTALHCAAYFGHESVMRELLAHGADPNMRGAVSDRPLHLAASKGAKAPVEALLEAGADPALTDDEANSALHFAAKAGHTAVIQLLLQRSPAPAKLLSMRNMYGDAALHVSCYAGRQEASKALVAAGSAQFIAAENVFSETPLHAACTSGRSIELVAYLLRQPGVDPNCQGSDGHTPLHSACYHGHVAVVQFLLENGADQSLTARAEQRTATTVGGLAFAARAESIPSGSSLTPSSTNGATPGEEQLQTPVLWAYEKGHDRIVALLKHYANKQGNNDVCSEYSSGDSSYTPLPSPLGRLRSMTKEKADILQLRAALNANFHVNLSDIEFQEAIGSGSFGKVYRGTFKGRPVAIKRYRATAFGSKSEVDMLCREVSILCRVQHPNVLAFVGAALDDPSSFAIITEFVESGSLFSLLHEQKRVLECAFRLRIAMDVAQGMRYLHDGATKPVIHRDLNSHNILIHSTGRAVVADFGESRFAGAPEESNNMTKQPGNLRWMAPEVFSCAGRYDRRADVFSYALCVWELHSAELPFAHLKPAAAAAEMAYKRARPPLPNEASLQFPDHVIRLLNTAWSHEPDSRPDFSQIVTLLAPFVDRDDAMDTSSSSATLTRDARGGVTGGGGGGAVSQLKTKWEQAPPTLPLPERDALGRSTGIGALHGWISTGTVEELRARLDKNGYIVQQF